MGNQKKDMRYTAKRKRSNNDLQNSTLKSKDGATYEPPLKPGVNSGAPGG